MRNRIIIFSVVILIVVLSVISVIQTPAVENENKKVETQKTETLAVENHQQLNTNVELTKTRAIAFDNAKAKAQDVVKEQLELLKKEQADSQSTSTPSNDNNDVYEDIIETDNSSSSNSTYVSDSSDSGYMLDINNPDYSYCAKAVSLSDSDRKAAESIVMGEAGSMGSVGMALVAQSLKDAFISGGYSSISETIKNYGYYGSMSITPSNECKDIVNYIFDQGGSAVQHRVLVFYAANVCNSDWHESQNFVCEYGNVRFFDRW